MAESAEFVAQITRCQRRLHSFILSLVWNPAEAEDVLQETNLVLWEKAAEFDASQPFLPWAMRFAQFQSLAWHKRHRRQQWLVFNDELTRLLADEAVQEERVFEDRQHALTACVQKLPVEQRSLIARRYQPDGSVNAIATAGGTTPKAISDRLRRIRHTLLQCVQKKLREATA